MSINSNDSTVTKKDLYETNENYLEKINDLRKKLNLLEIKEEKSALRTSNTSFHLSDSSLRTDDEIVEIPSDFSAHLSPNSSKKTNNLENKTRNSGDSFVLMKELTTITESPGNSIASSVYSQLKYHPPFKKMCRRLENSSNKIKELNEPEENQLKQCYTHQLGNKEFDSSSGSDYGDFVKIDRNGKGDGLSLRNCKGSSHIVPEVIIKEAENVDLDNSKCVKFLPIVDDEEDLCNFQQSVAASPNSHPFRDGYFQEQQLARKKRFTKKIRSNRIGCGDVSSENANLVTHFLEVPENPPKTPKKTSDAFKFPAVTKLSELMRSVDDEATAETPETFRRQRNVSDVRGRMSSGAEIFSFKHAVDSLVENSQIFSHQKGGYFESKGTERFSWRKSQNLDINYYNVEENCVPKTRFDLRRDVDQSDPSCFEKAGGCCGFRRIFRFKK